MSPWVKLDENALDHPKVMSRSRRMLRHLIPIWGAACAYCGAIDCYLKVEHMIPLSRGGIDKLPNMAPACRDCNQRKGARTPEEFGVLPQVHHA